MMKRILATAVLAALAAGTQAEDTNKQQGEQKQQAQQTEAGKQQGAAGAGSGKQAQRGGSAPEGAPAIVLVPLVVAGTPNFGDECWARLYDGQNFQGDQLTVVGPTEMRNMRTAFGTDWSGSFDSAQIGPKATVTVYDNENFGQKVATFQPNQRIADLDERRGFFEDIRSLKIACAGGAATGGTSSQQKKQKQ